MLISITQQYALDNYVLFLRYMANFVIYFYLIQRQVEKYHKGLTSNSIPHVTRSSNETVVLNVFIYRHNIRHR